MALKFNGTSERAHHTGSPSTVSPYACFMGFYVESAGMGSDTLWAKAASGTHYYAMRSSNPAGNDHFLEIRHLGGTTKPPAPQQGVATTTNTINLGGWNVGGVNVRSVSSRAVVLNDGNIATNSSTVFNLNQSFTLESFATRITSSTPTFTDYADVTIAWAATIQQNMLDADFVDLVHQIYDGAHPLDVLGASMGAFAGRSFFEFYFDAAVFEYNITSSWGVSTGAGTLTIPLGPTQVDSPWGGRWTPTKRITNAGPRVILGNSNLFKSQIASG